VEADLIRQGLRIRDLGTERFNWRDFKHLVTNLGPGSALHRSLGGRYTASDYLLVVIANTLRTISWQLSAGKERDRPEPFYLPGMDDSDPSKTADTYQADVMTIEEMDEWLKRGE
jgi:hypothetical protein